MISVVMCSRNRAEQLRRVLTTAAAMERPAGVAWEFLLIDNGSTDHTREVALSFADILPIRHIFEPEAGLSNARNRGVNEAKGDYICWTDDDVMIDQGWLKGYASAFARHPEIAYFGGPIELHFETEALPSWFQENRPALGILLAERVLGDNEIALNPDTGDMPFGANYAVRAADQRRHLYDPALGVSPLQRRLGEESAVLHAIAAEGKPGLWVPAAKVLHIIPPHRLKLDYIIEYEQSAGETAAYLSQQGMINFMGNSTPTRYHILGVPANLWFTTPKRWIGYRMSRLWDSSPQWVERLRWYAFQRGAFNYWLKASRRARPK